MNHDFSWPFIYLGCFLLVGYAAHTLGKSSHVPRVTLLLLMGALAGPELLALVPEEVVSWFPYATHIALSIVGFLLGERFLGNRLKKLGRSLLLITLIESTGAALFVFAAIWAVTRDLQLAFLLAAVAPSTAPAATLDLVRESNARGPLTEILMEVVAIDDVIGIFLFSIFSVLAGSIDGAFTADALLVGAKEVIGGILVGLLFGFPMAWVTGRARPGELTLVETMGFVLICGGVAAVLGTSYLLASIVLGAVVANRAKHHTRPFHEIENISQPFLIVFFLLAGFEFVPSALPSLGLAGATYLFARAAGKFSGAHLGARLVKAHGNVVRYLGLCLLPQAGVALGLGLLVAQNFPEYGEQLLTLLVGTTFVFELIGPLLTRWALHLAGEVPTSPDNPSE